MSTSPIAIEYFPKAQSTFQIPHFANNNAYLGDVVGSSPDSPVPIAGGLFRITKGQPLTCTYGYSETLIVLEGSFDVVDAAGNKSTGVPGDIYYFPKGSSVTFVAEDYGLAFYTAQRAKK